MSEYLPQQGLMWIRLVPGEKPIWIGGDYHVKPTPDIAHLFANTASSRRERGAEEGIMDPVRARARRELKASIDEALRRYHASLGRISPWETVEGSIEREIT